MKVFAAILSFMLSWTIIAFITAIIISFVFMVDYAEVVHNPLFVVIMIFLNSTISGIVADEVYSAA
jgi:hypothetical protein